MAETHASKSGKATSKTLLYKGMPFVRSGDIAYLGNPAEEYIVMFHFTNTTKIKDLDVPEKIIVQLVATDETLPVNQRFLKNSEETGLYNAMDLGAIWLTRAVNE